MSTRVTDLLFGAGLKHEPVAKRVRADGVVDTTRAVLVWEPRRVTPLYAVPAEDLIVPVAPGGETLPAPDGVLHPGIPFAAHTAPGEPLTVGEHAGAGFRLADPDLDGYVLLDFHPFEWLEEDEPIRGHPRDPFSRIDVRVTSRLVRIERDGRLLAESTRARLLFETGIHTRFYLPREDVLVPLEPSDTRSYCPYKGEASYWSAGGHRDIAWSYEDPLPDLRQITGLVAFWDERVDVVFDGQRRGRAQGEIADAMRDEFGA
ncbi:DUF427 domain-containing protein [Solirubrobacter sp. CPCC 204708]|uniref:DUF427 domain-containing protein n=1 Tax=Solirubrobacter deserti TaxID=2282478 RepID=A0ABT4RFE4_9ACTN|nr:DUF427 domain-containing protein [Solirubrobacter deserti]MBE2318633.1 DUF427 domain-containing protein [Solirubrobacter deserti]MDA0137091.1 DUF427 domain-containing protein [Solirubrobacter deserti]